MTTLTLRAERAVSKSSPLGIAERTLKCTHAETCLGLADFLSHIRDRIRGWGRIHGRFEHISNICSGRLHALDATRPVHRGGDEGHHDDIQ